jgi:hypothetical protein
MATVSRQPRYSREEFARRGDEIYDRDILPKLKPEDAGKFVAIDIETGDHEMASDELTAADGVCARHPEARLWLRRVGSPYVYRLGYHRKTA